MNEIYPPGTIVECVSVFGRVEPAPGRRVVVLRTNEHNETEATVKELVEQDGELWLVPKSSNPAHQPIRLGQQEPGITEVKIAAVVVASVRPE
jgi:SOS-response transcriptional repressor LexA